MEFVFTCLHCQELFVISHNDFNCRILRHGVYKENLQPMNPHATKEECSALLRDGKIYGCAGPLEIVVAEGTPRYEIRICDYI